MSRAAVAVRRGLPAEPGVGAPADRRFRRHTSRPVRRSWKRVAGRAAFFGLVGLMVLGAGAATISAIVHAPGLAVAHIVVRGNSRLSSGEVEALVDGLRGQSILLVDFEEFSRRLMDSPWVGRVTLSRVFPATVAIEIQERAPMAVARLGSQLYLVDDRGMIIDQYGPEYRQYDLPIVDGLVRSPSPDGPVVDDAGVRSVGLLLESLRSRPELRRRVSQIDASDPRDLVVLLDDDAARLHVGDTRFAERLTMYLQVAEALRDRVREIDAVDLRLDDLDRITVTKK